MKTLTKYVYEWVVQGHYGNGWEDLTTETGYREGIARLREYNTNEMRPHRLVRRRTLRGTA